MSNSRIYQAQMKMLVEFVFNDLKLGIFGAEMFTSKFKHNIAKERLERIVNQLNVKELKSLGKIGKNIRYIIIINIYINIDCLHIFTIVY